MKRRSFLKATSLAATPFLIKGIPVSGAPYTGNKLLDALAQNAYNCGKILVIVQMNGGNDALNMVFPMDKWSNLVNARSNILLNQNQVLPLNNNNSTGLHPQMTAMQQMYNDGKLMIVQGVSYPNPNFSHFRATDIWFSGSGSNTVLDTGWLGRELDAQFTGFPTGFPNSDMSDPLAIQIGSTLPFSLQGPKINMGYNVPNPNALLNVINGITDPAPNNDYGRELSFLRIMKDQSNAYRSVIQNAYNTTQSQSATYPANNSLADQLKIVAKLVNGGLQTPIYIVNHPNSHDSHQAQVNTTDHSTGTQPNNFKILSEAIGAFQKDLGLMGKDDKVTGMTYSEFGRRIKSNDSIGTDHGVAAPVMFFGAALNTSSSTVAGTAYPVPGMIGSSPDLPASATVNDQVPMQFDFRQLYATVMRDWFCLGEQQTNDVLGSAFNRLPIFKSAVTAPPGNIELTGQYLGGEAKLVYMVHENTKYKTFSIEFSPDGITYTIVKTLTNTSLNNIENYFYNDTTNAPTLYYRIAGENYQGLKTYSNVLQLTNNVQKQMLSVFPNPVKNNTINIKFYADPGVSVDVVIYSMTGSRLFYNRFARPGSVITFKVPQFLPHEHYVLEITAENIKVHEQIMFE